MSHADSLGERRPDLVLFGPSFVHSEAFTLLFREGMTLVEDAAAYLDGEGRNESRRLGHRAALAYAGESMRLTTRLMQIASWLLVQRAVSEGEITPGQADREKRRVRLSRQESTASAEDFAALPERVRGLIGQSIRLHARIMHLDAGSVDAPPALVPGVNPVSVQHGLLRACFGARGRG